MVSDYSREMTEIVMSYLEQDAAVTAMIDQWASTASNILELGDRFQQYVRFASPLVNQSSLYTGLLNQALSDVDWIKAVERFWDKHNPENDNDEVSAENPVE